MKLITVIALMVFATSSFATEYVSKKMGWSPMTSSGWNQTFYNCDWAEDQVESHLQSLGAQNVHVSCSGGIETGWTGPISISARFDVPVNGTVAKDVVLSGRESCSFNTQFLDRAIPMFPGVTLNSRRSSCMGGRLDSWKYELTVTE